MKITLFILVLFSLNSFSQNIHFRSLEDKNIDSKTFVENLKKLNQEVLHSYKNNDSTKYYDNVFRFYILGEDYKNGLYYLKKLKNVPEYKSLDYNEIIGVQFELFALAKLNIEKNTFREKYEDVFNKKINYLRGKSRIVLGDYFVHKEDILKTQISNFLKTDIHNDSISMPNAVKLCRYYLSYLVAKETNNIAKPLIRKLDKEDFLVKDSVIVKTKKGNEITLLYVLDKKLERPKPSILHFSTYTGNNDYLISAAKINSDKGYNIVFAFSRGVYLSKDEITPFEFEVEDVNEVIEWITKQSWSDGKVGMIGGSYDGFSQWAATKNLHPALKTIIPAASVGFGIDFPLENNVFNTYMIRWSEYVVKNRYSYYDDSNNDKWISLVNKLYQKGIPFKQLDLLNGNTNVIFQKWLMHPSFDKYWQSKIPYKKDFSKINIPILTFTGYFDDDQRGAMYYFNEHYKYNKNANHYLIIGPYDHFGAQGNIKNNIRGYIIDSVANIEMDQLSYEWFDYVLKGKEKPKFLKDKVNYQVMGTNQWKSATSIDKISNKKLKLFLSDGKLQEKKTMLNYISQKIDFSKREDTLQNFDRNKILDTVIDFRILKDKLIFESKRFEHSFEINGNFIGNIKTSINKRDIDITIKLYESMPNGKYFLLSSYLGRASYAKNKEKRQLITPNKIEQIPIHNTYFVSKKIEKGSKLILVLGVNKSPYEQINYGTGKDVSEETIADAKEPLEIKWYNDSYVEIPISEK